MELSKGNALRVVLLGKSGAGKSATGNTLLGSPYAFRTGKSFDTPTTASSVKTAENNSFIIQAADTPGFADPADCVPVLKEIVTSLSLVAPGPHAILFVVSLSTRFTEEEYNAYRALKHLLGEGFTRHLILVFTHGDCLTDEATTFSSLVETAPPQLVRILEECEFRHVIFDNTRPDAQQVDSLVGIVKELSRQYDYFSTPLTENSETQLVKELETRLKQAQEQETRRERTVVELQKLTEEIRGTIKNLDELKDRQQRLIQELLEEENFETRRLEAVKKVKEYTDIFAYTWRTSGYVL